MQPVIGTALISGLFLALASSAIAAKPNVVIFVADDPKDWTSYPIPVNDLLDVPAPGMAPPDAVPPSSGPCK